VNLDTPWLAHWSPIPAIQLLSVTIGYPVQSSPIQSNPIEGIGNLTVQDDEGQGGGLRCRRRRREEGEEGPHRGELNVGLTPETSSAVARNKKAAGTSDPTCQ
jgi:hypothetical protein